jgi:hypothetical protein
MILLSCQSETSLKGESINLYGGASRANSYERFGSFVVNVSTNEKIFSPDSSDMMIPPLALSSYRTVCATVEGSIIQFTSAMVEWSAKLDTGRYVVAGMCADGLQNIYAVGSDGYVYSFASDGKRRFKTRIPSEDSASYRDILAVSDGIILTSTSGTVSKVSFEGKVLWHYISLLSSVSMSSADDQNIYTSLTHNDVQANDTLLCLSSDGKCRWKIGVSARLMTAPVVGNGRIAVGVVQLGIPKILTVGFNGKELWIQEVEATPRGISMATDGSIITVSYNAGIGTPQSSIEQFSLIGKHEWTIKFNALIASPALIGTTNIALIGVQSSAIGVYLINRKGVLDTFLSLDSAPALILKPIVAPGGNIIFAAARHGYITRVGAKRGFLPI